MVRRQKLNKKVVLPAGNISVFCHPDFTRDKAILMLLCFSMVSIEGFTFYLPQAWRSENTQLGRKKGTFQIVSVFCLLKNQSQQQKTSKLPIKYSTITAPKPDQIYWHLLGTCSNWCVFSNPKKKQHSLSPCFPFKRSLFIISI